MSNHEITPEHFLDALEEAEQDMDPENQGYTKGELYFVALGASIAHVLVKRGANERELRDGVDKFVAFIDSLPDLCPDCQANADGKHTYH